MTRTLMDYELEPHVHQGNPIHGARHSTCAPFSCNAPLALAIEANPMRAVPGERLVTERCQGCGRVVNLWHVLPEWHLANNDADDDGA